MRYEFIAPAQVFRYVKFSVLVAMTVQLFTDLVASFKFIDAIPPWGILAYCGKMTWSFDGRVVVPFNISFLWEEGGGSEPTRLVGCSCVSHKYLHRMHRQKRDPALIAKAVAEQKRLVVCISKIETENDEDVAEVAASLEHGVDSTAKDYNLSLYYASKNYFSPLHYAARKGAFRILDLLLKHKANPNAKDRYEVTPLHLAAENGWPLCVKRLIEAGAIVNARTRYWYQSRCLPGRNTEAMSMFPELPYTGGTTPLHLAAAKNNIECVRLLMWEGADYNAANADGETSLYLAAARMFQDCVLTQLHNAISVPILAIPNYRNDTPLHECLRHGEPMTECVKELVKHGSDVSFRNMEGDSPMHLALKYQWDPSIIQLLVYKGYNLNFDYKDRNYEDYKTKSPLDLVVYGEPTQKVVRDEAMATFFIKMGCSRELLSILSNELKTKEPAGPILEAVMNSFAYLPSLSYVLEVGTCFERILRRPVLSNSISNEQRRRKQEDYLRHSKTVPSLQHLCRCCIRNSLTEVRKVTCLPLPRHMKSYILLNQQIPEDML